MAFKVRWHRRYAYCIRPEFADLETEGIKQFFRREKVGRFRRAECQDKRLILTGKWIAANE